MRLITGSEGTTLAIHDYYPFGMEAYGAADSERMNFTRHELDEMGTAAQGDDLYNMQARFYNPSLARFLSPDLLRGDPHQPQSFNLFAYVAGNPMTYVDPWGFGAWDPAKNRESEEITVGGDYWAWQRNPLNTLLYGGVYGSGGGGRLPGKQLLGRATPAECLALAPVAPVTVSVNSNMRQAGQHPVDTGNGYRNIYNLLWLINRVRPGGAWDYKIPYGRGLEDFGNFNYGAAFTSAHVPPGLTVWGAGAIQILSGTSTMAWTFPIGVGPAPWQLPTLIPPHGDDPRDQAYIDRGIAYSKGGCGE